MGQRLSSSMIGNHPLRTHFGRQLSLGNWFLSLDRQSTWIDSDRRANHRAEHHREHFQPEIRKIVKCSYQAPLHEYVKIVSLVRSSHSLPLSPAAKLGRRSLRRNRPICPPLWLRRQPRLECFHRLVEGEFRLRFA